MCSSSMFCWPLFGVSNDGSLAVSSPCLNKDEHLRDFYGFSTQTQRISGFFLLTGGSTGERTGWEIMDCGSQIASDRLSHIVSISSPIFKLPQTKSCRNEKDKNVRDKTVGPLALDRSSTRSSFYLHTNLVGDPFILKVK